jgi:hypothetical protein
VLDSDVLRSAAMFPATSGPRAVAVGLATTRTETTVTLRARASDFHEDEVRALLALISEAFVADPA